MRGIVAIIALLVMLEPRSAFAQSQDAESLLRDGVAQRRAGDDAGAVVTFQRALAIDPSGNALGQLGLAEQAIARWSDADEHLRAALATHDPWVERNRSALEDAHRIVLTHVPASTHAVTTHEHSPLRTVGIVGLGVGGAALVAGIVAWIVRESTVQSYNGRCRGLGDPSPPTGCDESSAVASASTAQNVAIVAGIGGLVVAGVAGLLFGLSPREHAPVAISCGSGPGAFGAACTVSF